MIELTHVHAAALGCAEELLHAREILCRGTSAHRQLAIFDQALAEGAEKDEALKRVVDFLIEETAKV